VEDETRNGHRTTERNPNRNHETIVLGLFSLENLKRAYDGSFLIPFKISICIPMTISSLIFHGTRCTSCQRTHPHQLPYVNTYLLTNHLLSTHTLSPTISCLNAHTLTNHLSSLLHPWDTHYQFSMKPLLSTHSNQRRFKLSDCPRGGGLGSSTIREVGGWGRVPLERWGAGVEYH